jgi:CheY-like chemotaxis protein
VWTFQHFRAPARIPPGLRGLARIRGGEDTSGYEALDRLTMLGERYDVILCDIMMPRVTGMEI